MTINKNVYTRKSTCSRARSELSVLLWTQRSPGTVVQDRHIGFRCARDRQAVPSDPPDPSGPSPMPARTPTAVPSEFPEWPRPGQFAWGTQCSKPRDTATGTAGPIWRGRRDGRSGLWCSAPTQTVPRAHRMPGDHVRGLQSALGPVLCGRGDF